jgi:hypothetical protein
MKSRLYSIYQGMTRRCYYPDNQNYKYYGGKGIVICNEWKTDFSAFKKWALENGYQDNLTIDRINTNGNYEPSNCRWVSMKEQCNNRTSNHLITYKGKTQNLKQWCIELNLNYGIMESRINRYKWSVEKAFETKTNFRMVMITYKNKTQTLKQWCDELDLNYKLTHSRIHRSHWDIEKTFEIKGVK